MNRTSAMDISHIPAALSLALNVGQNDLVHYCYGRVSISMSISIIETRRKQEQVLDADTAFVLWLTRRG